MDIQFLSIGPNKEQIINIVRKATGLGLLETKDFVDSVNYGVQTLRNVSDVTFDELKSSGATVKKMYTAEDEFARAINGETKEDESEAASASNSEIAINSNSIETLNDSAQNSSQSNSRFVPIVPPNMISSLDRESTMKVLIEAGKIAKESEDCEAELRQLVKQKEVELYKVKELRKAVSKIAKLTIWVVTLAAFSLGLLGGFLCIVTGLGALIIMNLTVKKYDLKKHEAENNANADAYYAKNVIPIEERLQEVYSIREELEKSGKKPWAIDVVGNDMFCSSCIRDLYDLLKNRRADNLKEALNKYDDAQHKARMEEMQAAIQNASEVAAKEAVKQTEYSSEIANNTRKTAIAAKKTAYRTKQIDKNTRRFR